MINKIAHITNFGIFKSFTWQNSINTFKQANLIYGWNYSGKTTFSKLFNNLNRKQKEHFPHAEYSFEVGADSKSYSHDQLSEFPYLVKVFNSDYVRKVFSWDVENGGKFEPILFYLGDEAGDVQPKIDSLSKRWNPAIESIKSKNNINVIKFENYSKDNGKFSKQATEIRKYLNDQIRSNEFNKSHFIEFVNQVKLNLVKYRIDPTNLIDIKNQALALNDLERLESAFGITELINQIGIEVNNILASEVPTSISFHELDNDNKVFNWVQTGLQIHLDTTICKFCSNTISDNRIDNLNNYYSNKVQEIQNVIHITRDAILKERTKLNINFPHESLIVKHYRDSYREFINKFKNKKEIYKAVLEVYENDLLRKERNYFNSINASPNTNVSMTVELDSIIEIIKNHNQFILHFDEKRNFALSQILQYYVGEYLELEDYNIKEIEYIRSIDIISRCNVKLISNNYELSKLESLLKNTVKGQIELNAYLKIFLNRDDIKIDIEKDKFVLKRGDNAALHLSEGETTAIAFSYFLTELKSLQEENILKKTIVFFDDPISSLDSNHIFQVRSLIEFFFNDKKTYLQLFISTHNFEFFSVMLDSTLFRNMNKNDSNMDKCPYYLISRTAQDSSVISNLPKALRSHKSEYAYIFSILKEYDRSENKDSFAYKILLPNTLRRFLELYTLFKFPKGYSEIDKRIKEVFNPMAGIYHNTKLYHWFSHQNQFEKVAYHDDKIFLIDEAIREVMKHIEEKDPLHWKGLTDTSSDTD